MEMMWKNHNGLSTMEKKGGNSHTSNVVATSQDSPSPSQQPWLQSIFHSLWVPRSRWHDWRQRSPGSVACNCQGANLHKLVSFQWGLRWDLDGSWWLGSTVCVSSRVWSQRLLRTKNTSKTFPFSLHFNFDSIVSSFLLGCGCGFNTKWSTLGTSGACVTSGIVAMDGGAVGSGVGWDFSSSSASASGGSFSGVSTFNQRLRSRTPETKPQTLGKSAGSGARKSLEEIGASRFSCRSAISGQVTK